MFISLAQLFRKITFNQGVVVLIDSNLSLLFLLFLLQESEIVASFWPGTTVQQI